MIEVIQTGAYTTVQGERAWRQAHLGIPLGGPADEASHRSANALAGNRPEEKALEVTLLGPALRFHAPALVAICGAPFEASIPVGQPVTVAAGQMVAIRGTPRGARCYLAVRGGLARPGGYVLQKGETIPLAGMPPCLGGGIVKALRLDSPVVLRYTANDPAPDLSFEVSNDANRRAIRLIGGALAGSSLLNREIITEGVNAGTIQVPPDGQPLILFYDQTTTGGYPKLGTIVRRDLDKVGQLRPRDQVVLRAVPFDFHEASD